MLMGLKLDLSTKQIISALLILKNLLLLLIVALRLLIVYVVLIRPAVPLPHRTCLMRFLEVRVPFFLTH